MQILNSSYREQRLPSGWKIVDVSPLPKLNFVVELPAEYL